MSADVLAQVGVTLFSEASPEVQRLGFTPVRSSGATGLTPSKGHRMGSEPFQFTSAPFHLRQGDRRERVAGARAGAPLLPTRPSGSIWPRQLLHTHTNPRTGPGGTHVHTG